MIDRNRIEELIEAQEKALKEGIFIKPFTPENVNKVASEADLDILQSFTKPDNNPPRFTEEY